MNTSSKLWLLTGIIALLGALLVLAGVAQAGPRPAGMSNAEYRALVLRSEALDRMYHLSKYRQVSAGMTAAEYRALMLRSEALDKKYGLGKWSRPRLAPRAARVAGGFAWSAFGIGAAAMAGLVLLTTGVIAGSRLSRHIPRARISS